MEWRTIRAHFERIYRAGQQERGLRQIDVARAGGLIGRRGQLQQNAVSRILHNKKLGPTVETFVRAVEGLGLSVSEFFEDIEQGRTSTAQTPLPGNHHREDAEMRTLEVLIRALQHQLATLRRRNSR